MKMKFIHLLTTITLLLLTACVNDIAYHGHELEGEEISKLVVGGADKAKVLETLGSPSVKSSYGQDSWYYISSQKKLQTVSKAKLLKQNVVVIEFNKNGVIQKIRHLHENDAKVIKIVKETTAVMGDDTSKFRQTIKNIGRFNKNGNSRTGPRKPNYDF
jgi:outer membrane protein assembly factor BamE (lipoprotein component of BamABCDE complex)